MRLEKLKPLSDEYLESIGFVWHTDSDNSSYVSDEIVVISENEANAYYEATNELYDMYAQAGQYVIDKGYVAAMNTNGTKLHKILTKIIKRIIIHSKNHENPENHRNPCENHENHLNSKYFHKNITKVIKIIEFL